MGYGEIAKARNIVSFNGTGSSEAGKSRSVTMVAKRSRIILGIVRLLGLKFFSLISCNADFMLGAILCEPSCADFVAGAALYKPPCTDCLIGIALWEPPCADFLRGTAQH